MVCDRDTLRYLTVVVTYHTLPSRLTTYATFIFILFTSHAFRNRYSLALGPPGVLRYRPQSLFPDSFKEHTSFASRSIKAADA